MAFSAKRALVPAVLCCVSLVTPGAVAARRILGAGPSRQTVRARAHPMPGSHGAVDLVTRLGPGAVLMRVRGPGGEGAINADVLRVDLGDPWMRVGLLYPGVVAAVQPLSAMADRAGALAAVNGDFFNIGASGAPIGPVVGADRLIKGPEQGRMLAAGVGVDGMGRVAPVWLRGSVSLPRGRRTLSDLNDASLGPKAILKPNGIALFTRAWGAYGRAGAVRGLGSVTEVRVRGRRVVHVQHQAGTGRIARGSYVLLGAGSGGRALARLRVGQAVSVSYGQGTSAPVPFRFAIGGKFRLLKAGRVQPYLPSAPGKPRTAIGFSEHGRVMYLVVTAGPASGVTGLSLPQLARFMRGLGIQDAVALDDGGSTTIVARLAARAGLTLLNRPADGSERSVANGVGVFAAPAPGAVLHIGR